MKKNPLLALFFIILVQIGFSSCDKDDDKEPSKTDMMTAHGWQGEKATAGGFDVAALKNFGYDFPDVSTITLNFTKNGTYTATYTNENGQVVNSNGAWSFQENETKLKFNFLEDYGIDETVNIKELSASRLTLTSTISLAGQPVPVEIFFIAK